jgi:hypothetical protein
MVKLAAVSEKHEDSSVQGQAVQEQTCLDCLNMNMKALPFFKMSVPVYQSACCSTLEDLESSAALLWQPQMLHLKMCLSWN